MRLEGNISNERNEFMKTTTSLVAEVIVWSGYTDYLLLIWLFSVNRDAD